MKLSCRSVVDDKCCGWYVLWIVCAVDSMCQCRVYGFSLEETQLAVIYVVKDV